MTSYYKQQEMLRNRNEFLNSFIKCNKKFSNKGDEIFVEVKDNGKFVEISVKDNGIGIEAGDLNKIFDRFKQVDKSLSRNSEGTGISLSLVKSFVESHGGSIKVKSKFGQGSKFIVKLL